MKNTFLMIAFLITAFSFGQKEKTLVLNEDSNLIEATYYHDNGVISQTGFFTLDGKLQGNWISYDAKGNKLVSANYDNGNKVGKWFYWNNKTLTEVDYDLNAINKVQEWESKSAVVVRN